MPVKTIDITVTGSAPLWQQLAVAASGYMNGKALTAFHAKAPGNINNVVKAVFHFPLLNTCVARVLNNSGALQGLFYFTLK